MSDSDEIERAEAALRARDRATRAAAIIAVALLFGAPGAYYGHKFWRDWRAEQARRLTPVESDEIRVRLGEIEERVRVGEAAWAEASARASLDELAPSDAPCPFTPDGDWTMHVAHGQGLIGPCETCVVDEKRFDDVRDRVVAGTAHHEDLAWARAASTEKGRDQVAVVTWTLDLPTYRGTQFVPGRAAGRAYLWKESEKRFVCAGDFSAATSPDAVQRLGPNATQVDFDNDLEAQMRRALVPSLRALK